MKMKENFKARTEELLIERRIVQHESKHRAEQSQDGPKTLAPPSSPPLTFSSGHWGWGASTVFGLGDWCLGLVTYGRQSSL